MVKYLPFCFFFLFFLSPSTFPTGTCSKLDAPANGRKLGKSHSVGHEVHFLCDPGYELVGSESRFCQESLAWSGQQTSCRGERRTVAVTLAGVSPRLQTDAVIKPTDHFLQPCHCPLCNLPCSLLFLCCMHVTNILSM